MILSQRPCQRREVLQRAPEEHQQRQRKRLLLLRLIRQQKARLRSQRKEPKSQQPCLWKEKLGVEHHRIQPKTESQNQLKTANNKFHNLQQAVVAKHMKKSLKKVPKRRKKLQHPVKLLQRQKRWLLFQQRKQVQLNNLQEAVHGPRTPNDIAQLKENENA